jgi:hypothetical protein
MDNDRIAVGGDTRGAAGASGRTWSSVSKSAVQHGGVGARLKQWMGRAGGCRVPVGGAALHGGWARGRSFYAPAMVAVFFF